jgi:hypothetical protein
VPVLVVQLHRIIKGADTMKTIAEIIDYLEAELAEAHEAHDKAKDKQERLFHLIKANTITSLLEEIKR